MSPKEVRKLWCEALRSGKYKQTQDVLCRVEASDSPVGHCCLGVLCELAVDHMPAGSFAISVTGDRKAFDGDDSLPPDAVRKWAGLVSFSGGYIHALGYMTSLTEENDDGKPFDDIADIIELEPEGLFIPEPACLP